MAPAPGCDKARSIGAAHPGTDRLRLMPRPSELEHERVRIRRLGTEELTVAMVVTLRALMVAAFGSDDEERFTDHDWVHALGGAHFVLSLDGEIVGHAAVVERTLEVNGRPMRTGYVEAVATAPDRQGQGLGTLLMTEVGDYIRPRYELGALGTGRHAFYERLGWVTWKGPSSVRAPDGERRTPDEDGYILVLPTESSRPLDLTASISCDWRPGDVW